MGGRYRLLVMLAASMVVVGCGGDSEGSNSGQPLGSLANIADVSPPEAPAGSTCDGSEFEFAEVDAESRAAGMEYIWRSDCQDDLVEGQSIIEFSDDQHSAEAVEEILSEPGVTWEERALEGEVPDGTVCGAFDSDAHRSDLCYLRIGRLLLWSLGQDGSDSPMAPRMESGIRFLESWVMKLPS